jgi:predicted amidophosphoribosyltransferase
LAREVARLLGTRVADVLSLSQPISKRRLMSAGYTVGQFEYRYYNSLEVSDSILKYSRILIVDDVCTQGTTLSCVLRKIANVHPACEAVATTAGQMILKAVVKSEGDIRSAVIERSS